MCGKKINNEKISIDTINVLFFTTTCLKNLIVRKLIKIVFYRLSSHNFLPISQQLLLIKGTENYLSNERR